MVNKGWLKKVSSTRAAKRFVRGSVIISKLIVNTKETNITIQNKIVRKLKKRLIPNLKRSGITVVAKKTETPQLPRILDVVFSNLELMRRIRTDEHRRLRHIILDFAHVFFNFPGMP